MVDKLQQILHYAAAGQVWKMTLDETGGRLYIAVRNEEAHEVQFHAFDLNKAQLLWEGLSFENSWWTELHEVAGNVMIFSTMHDSQNPSERTWFGLDGEEHHLLWQMDDFYFEQAGAEVFCGWSRSDEEAKRCFYRLIDGEEIGNKALPLEKNSPAENIPVSFPLHYSEESPHFATFGRYIRHFLQAEPRGAVDYLELEHRLILSGYVGVGKKLENFLLVLNKEGEQLHYDTLGTELPGIASDTFMVWDKLLIYVKHKNELHGYALD